MMNYFLKISEWLNPFLKQTLLQHLTFDRTCESKGHSSRQKSYLCFRNKMSQDLSLTNFHPGYWQKHLKSNIEPEWYENTSQRKHAWIQVMYSSYLDWFQNHLQIYLNRLSNKSFLKKYWKWQFVSQPIEWSKQQAIRDFLFIDANSLKSQI